MSKPKRGFLFWFNTIFGVVGVISGFYFYFEGRRERIPTFIVDPIRTTIVDRNYVAGRPIEVLDSAGREIDGNVNAITFYFFNQGNQSIKKENLYDPPLRIFFSDTSVKIIDYSVLRISREATGLSLTRSNKIPNSVFIDFKILEEMDGFTCQLFYIGETNATLAIEGAIEEVKKISTSYYDRNETWTAWLRFGLAFLCGSPFLIFIFWLFGIWPLKHSPEELKELEAAGINSDRFNTKYQLIIRSVESPNEQSAITFTYARVLLFSVGTFVFMFVMSLFLSTTLLSKWFDPRYTEKLPIPTEIVPHLKTR